MTKLCPIYCSCAKVASGKFVNMDFKFVFPSIYINFDTETNFEVNQTQISHSIPKNTPKNHQSGHISKTKGHRAKLLSPFDFSLKNKYLEREEYQN